MSWLSKYVFDPIKAAAFRAQSSSNPTAQAVGQAATVAIANVGAQASALALSPNSVMGQASPLVQALEDGLRGVVDAAVGSAAGPLAPEAVPLADAALVFLEQHAMTYLSSLFGHVQAARAAPKPLPTSPFNLNAADDLAPSAPRA